MTATSLTSTPTASVTKEPKEHYVAKYIVLPGALGGLTKVIMEVQESINNLQVVQSAQARPEINLPALGYLVPCFNRYCSIITAREDFQGSNSENRENCHSI